ncbi:4'-phosphopantetheinyl transferase [Kitasatospora sp. MMS16-BH015]|uniref:4'-phosphopantetheinyl transferase family protein n=1 Tax=Kitasatospora sp. MMS16-BH015 TaxID=2018025 RepID=UPI000CA209B6|nr:4'-phosphopantetheinyl transferase superfamily protein [Kitasatospora sp. MMS16-BH015]AUG80454.1 4'-phosphopantetheinyl transferase [Kitasatospora sp. MMS16-BH015]
MIERIVDPALVAAASSTADSPVQDLHPAERARIARSVAARQAEYATTRACARRAMAQLGVAAGPVLTGEHGEPRWPVGLVGSLTHCAGYRAAAVGRAEDLLAIGIDAEPNGALKDGVLEAVSLPAEREWIRRLSGPYPGVAWDRLLFSAKEAVYKAWYPLTHRRLEFDQALITVDRVRGTFEARLLVPGPEVDGTGLTVLPGRWLAGAGLVVTSVVLPRTSLPPQ